MRVLLLDGTLNASYNCIDRHLKTKHDQTALIWEGDELGDEERITYADLHALTVKIAVSLRSLGVGPGDRVAFYMPSQGSALGWVFSCFFVPNPEPRIVGCVLSRKI